MTNTPAAVVSTFDGNKPESASDALRAPFPAALISKLPKQLRRNDDNKARCEQGTHASADGYFCGGYHARSIHLDYIGHADVTARLLEVDPGWDWEPVAWGQDDMPRRDAEGGMWIRLTVGGVTRLGYGDAQGKHGPNAVKEVIGDALRNAAMRFGVGLDLWSKAEAHAQKAEPSDPPAPPKRQQNDPPQQRQQGGPRQQAHDDLSRREAGWLKAASGSDKTREQVLAVFNEAREGGARPDVIGKLQKLGEAAARRAQQGANA